MRSCSVYIENLGVNVDSQWSDTSKVLTLQLKNGGAPSSNSRGGRGGFGNNPNNPNKRGGKQGNNGGGGGNEVEYGPWLASLPSLSNPLSMSPVALPLTVRVCVCVVSE